MHKLKFKSAAWALGIGMISSILWITTSEFRVLKMWEMRTYDARMMFARPSRHPPENVVMFYVDEPSLRQMEMQGLGWPWPRELYAAAMEFAGQGGARAVVFDLFFSEDSVYGPDDDLSFAKGVANGPPSYFALFLSGGESAADPRVEAILEKTKIPLQTQLPAWTPSGQSLASLPVEPLIGAARGFGNVQIPPDDDGIYRRIPLIGEMNGEAIPSLPFKVATDVTDANSISWPVKQRLVFGNALIPLDDDGRMLINYYGKAGSFPAYSLSEVIVSQAAISKGQAPTIAPTVVKDKVVIIGLAAPGLYDLKPTPFSRVFPGPEIHATVIENLITSDFILPVSRLIAISITLACGLLASIGLAGIGRAWGQVSLIVALSFALVGAAGALFSSGIWMPLIPPLGALSLSSFSMIFKNYMTEGRKKREIRRAFGQYLSPHVVREIANDPSALTLGGKEEEITIFFSDIADFTTISEKTPPPKLVERLNLYFSLTTRIIQERGGTLDKYIGDAIMAFWGAPLKIQDHAARAVLAALDIQEKLNKGSEFTTRIGIHTGPAVVGNIGSDIRFNYTAIGDAVNLASRLEGLNKQFGTLIIASEATHDLACAQLEARRIGKVRVKGRLEPIDIYEPLGPKGDFGRLGEDGLRQFAEALALFESAKFKEAKEVFTGLAATHQDPTSIRYQGQCDSYLHNPPKEFDGVIVFTTK